VDTVSQSYCEQDQRVCDFAVRVVEVIIRNYLLHEAYYGTSGNFVKLPSNCSDTIYGAPPVLPSG